LLLVEEKLM